MSIPTEKWGKDHWSCFAYIEHRVVDHLGIPDLRHMRSNPDIHPGLANPLPTSNGKKYPTRLNDGTKVEEHDDWSCVEDMEAAGLLTWEGTGINPMFVLTDEGHRVAAALRKHKADGGQFNAFRYPEA